MAPVLFEATAPYEVARTADAVVCHCLQIRESTVVDCVEAGKAETVRDITLCTGAGVACMACHCRLKRILRERR